jgi:hypothetical protein
VTPGTGATNQENGILERQLRRLSVVQRPLGVRLVLFLNTLMATAVLQQQQQATAEPDAKQKVKVFVSGCYDILHGGQWGAPCSQKAALPAVQLLQDNVAPGPQPLL